MENAQFGMVGLGTMGRNFLLNVAEHGFSCVGYDLDASKRELLTQEGAGMPVESATSVAEFVAKLQKPRNIMLLVPAGKIVDAAIDDLLPFLEKDDLIIDGGNSHFADTERREAVLIEKGIEFMGVGVSGGEEGARHGASIMPGGRREFYERVAPIFEAVSAKVNGEPCVAYMGASSAGHFVKMVHNGIEYGLMQILAETYDFLHRVMRLNYLQMSDIFAEWNTGDLNSFLVEITAEVLKKTDAKTGKPLVEMILDKAGQKGTGKWTSQTAMDFGVPVPTIDAAVSMRQISAQKEVRLLVAEKYGFLSVPVETDGGDGTVSSEKLPENLKHKIEMQSMETPVSQHHKETIGEVKQTEQVETQFPNLEEKAIDHLELDPIFNRTIDETEMEFLNELKTALLSSFVVTYAQGLSLLQAASIEKNYNLNLAEIARIWRGGCIIRSALLEEMRRAYAENPDLPNLILDDSFAEILNRQREDWRIIAEKFAASRVPALCLSSTLQYFDAFRSERLPANLIQAQRDFFGAHTYQRIDEEGIFHTPDWKE
ncbi:MAG TPA: NADP-dependent phosphogluconate dehydrogenase [Pyrinomonadaceae bacterium]|jgi:6-phosphogluconate dehydrogenase